MIRHVLADICPDTLRPLNKAEVYRRAARRAAIANEQARVAKRGEAYLPPDEQRQVIDLHELSAACIEVGTACAVAAPVALVAVFIQLSA